MEVVRESQVGSEQEVVKEPSIAEIKAKKQELFLYMQNQIKELKPQLEYRRITTELAELRTRELKAEVEGYTYLAQLQQIKQGINEPKIHTLTQDDLDKIPVLVEKGFEVGDQIDLSKPPHEQVKFKKD